VLPPHQRHAERLASSLLVPHRAHTYQPRSTALAPYIPATLQAYPVLGDYLAKRSQLVADRADQVRDRACQGDAEPIWAHREATRESRSGALTTASIPKTRDQPGGGQLETASALWKQRLDRDTAGPPACQQMRGPSSHTQDAPHSVRATSGSARSNNPNGVRAGRRRPADSTPQWSDRGARTVKWRKWAGRVGGTVFHAAPRPGMFPNPAIWLWSSSVAAPGSVTSARSATACGVALRSSYPAPRAPVS
jgi:hypothetical protein